MPCPFNIGEVFNVNTGPLPLHGRWRVTACGLDWCEIEQDPPGFRGEPSAQLEFDLTLGGFGGQPQPFWLRGEQTYWWTALPSTVQQEISRRRDQRRRQWSQVTATGIIARDTELTIGDPETDFLRQVNFRCMEVHANGVIYVEPVPAQPAATEASKPSAAMEARERIRLESRAIPTRFERDLEIDDA